jgi:hypothetical protein
VVVGQWQPIHSVTEMLGVLSQRIAVILFGLAWLHYQNIAVLLLWSRFKYRRQPQFQQP